MYTTAIISVHSEEKKVCTNNILTNKIKEMRKKLSTLEDLPNVQLNAALYFVHSLKFIQNCEHYPEIALINNP